VVHAESGSRGVGTPCSSLSLFFSPFFSLDISRALSLEELRRSSRMGAGISAGKRHFLSPSFFQPSPAPQLRGARTEIRKKYLVKRQGRRASPLLLSFFPSFFLEIWKAYEAAAKGGARDVPHEATLSPPPFFFPLFFFSFLPVIDATQAAYKKIEAVMHSPLLSFFPPPFSGNENEKGERKGRNASHSFPSRGPARSSLFSPFSI